MVTGLWFTLVHGRNAVLRPGRGQPPAMAVLNRLGGAAGGRTVAAMASAAARLLRAYATQVEALRRLRNGNSQTVRVEHVANNIEDRRTSG
jgi:hypothetical protein